MTRSRIRTAAAALSAALLALASPARADETIRGRVARVELEGAGPGARVVLQVAAAAGTVPVRLGPSWWMEDQLWEPEPGDEVEVLVEREASGALRPRTVRSGRHLLTLVAEDGGPAWSAAGAARGRCSSR